MAGSTKWSMETEYIQSCNCAYGCPCNFNALPTHGNCQGLVGYRIRKGRFDRTKLDGVKLAWGLWWPGAIHHGRGVSRLYIDPAATPDQQKAVTEIFSGKHGGGVFAIFSTTFARVLPPKLAKIDWKFKGYASAFSVQGIGGVESTHVRNPVTNAEFQGEVVFPLGLNFKRALVTSIKKLSLHDADVLNFDHENTAGFVTVTRYTDQGPTSSRTP